MKNPRKRIIIFIIVIIILDKLKDFENKSGYPKAWFFIGFCGLIASFLLLLGGAKLIVDLLGFVYPAYMSFKSMDANNHKDNTQWLTYWVVFSFISITESVFSFIVAFIPMYYWFKIAAIIVRDDLMRKLICVTKLI